MSLKRTRSFEEAFEFKLVYLQSKKDGISECRLKLFEYDY